MSINTDRSLVTLKKELFRKSIHISGFLVPILSIMIGIAEVAFLIVCLSVAYFISEYYRLRGRTFPTLTTITKIAMRDHMGEEQKNMFVKEPLYFAAGILISLLIFPAPLNYVAIAVVTLGDGLSSIVGRMYGKHKIPYSNGKSLEGTLAGIFCAFAGSLIFVSPVIAFTAAAVGMGVELMRLRISDNLTVPLVSGLTVLILDSYF